MGTHESINQVIINPGPDFVVRRIVQSGDCVAEIEQPIHRESCGELPSGNNWRDSENSGANLPERETLDFPKLDPYEHISPTCEVKNAGDPWMPQISITERGED